jgi:hypothetical protein
VLSLFVYMRYGVIFVLNKNFPIIIMIKRLIVTMSSVISFVLLFLLGSSISNAQDYMTNDFDCSMEIVSEAKTRCSVLIDEQAVEDCMRKNLISAKKDGDCGDRSDFHDYKKTNSFEMEKEDREYEENDKWKKREEKIHTERDIDTRMIVEIFGKAVGMLISLSQEDLPDEMRGRVQKALLWFSEAVGKISRGEDVGALVGEAKSHLYEIVSMISTHPGRGPDMGVPHPGDPVSSDPRFSGPSMDEMKVEIEDMLAMSEEMLNKIPMAFKRMAEKGYEIGGWEEEVDAARERLREMRSICGNAIESEARDDFDKCFEGFKNFFERHMRKLEMLATENAPHEVLQDIDKEFGFDDYGPKNHGPPPMHEMPMDEPPMHYPGDFPPPPMYDGSTGEQFDGYMGTPTHINVPPEFTDPGPDFYYRPDYPPPPPRWDDDGVQIHDMGPGRMRNLKDPYNDMGDRPAGYDGPSSPMDGGTTIMPPPHIEPPLPPYDPSINPAGMQYLPSGTFPPPLPPPPPPIGDSGGQYLPGGTSPIPLPPPPPPIGDGMMMQDLDADGIADY